MKHNKLKWTLMVLALAAVVVAGGCKKKQVPATPPAAPPPPQPKATLSVSPESVNRGGAATLTWSTQDATDVKIEGIGSVQPSGSQAVSPSNSTTYRLTATGPGGSTDATARLTVVEPPPPPPVAVQENTTEEQLFAQSVKDIYFDYDRYDLRAEDKAAIDANAAFLKAHPSIRFTIEGHCDERGSTDYNLALGDNRANSARSALVNAGIPASQIKVISFGKEKPFCTESNESCWQQNRRAHFVYGQK
ncbi:MAG: peptidoglycan-associated lipoprotein Pal [Terracidiphilus sp.]|nr:peptidoglycan-associated lipoprotein Pal [Terracidiphilus sp.]